MRISGPHVGRSIKRCAHMIVMPLMKRNEEEASDANVVGGLCRSFMLQTVSRRYVNESFSTFCFERSVDVYLLVASDRTPHKCVNIELSSLFRATRLGVHITHIVGIVALMLRFQPMCHPRLRAKPSTSTIASSLSTYSYDILHEGNNFPIHHQNMH